MKKLLLLAMILTVMAPLLSAHADDDEETVDPIQQKKNERKIEALNAANDELNTELKRKKSIQIAVQAEIRRNASQLASAELQRLAVEKEIGFAKIQHPENFSAEEKTKLADAVKAVSDLKTERASLDKDLKAARDDVEKIISTIDKNELAIDKLENPEKYKKSFWQKLFSKPETDEEQAAEPSAAPAN